MSKRNGVWPSMWRSWKTIMDLFSQTTRFLIIFSMSRIVYLVKTKYQGPKCLIHQLRLMKPPLFSCQFALVLRWLVHGFLQWDLGSLHGRHGAHIERTLYEKVRQTLQGCKKLGFTNGTLTHSCVGFTNSHMLKPCLNLV